MGMPVEEFLAIVQEGWRVIIGTDGTTDPASGVWQLQRAQLADAATPATNNLEIVPVDGEVNPDQVFKALVFLGKVSQRAGGDDNPQHRLVLAFLASDPSHPPPLADGMHYTPAPDGSRAITDNRGTPLATIASGASMADAGDAAVGAMATRAAGGLMSSPSKVLPASSGEMNASAVIAEAEIDAMVAALQAMPAERRPIPAGLSADEVKRSKASQTAERQRQLQSEITTRLVGKGVVPAPLPADDLSALCQKYNQTFQRTESDGRAGYVVTDSRGNFVAGGPFATSRWQGDYLAPAGVSRLLDQLGTANLLNAAAAVSASPDAIEALQKSQVEVEKYRGQSSRWSRPPGRFRQGP